MSAPLVAPATAPAVAPVANWDAVVAAWLAEVERRTGSKRTPAEYGAYVRAFVAMLGAQGVDPGAAQTAHVFAFANAPLRSGRAPSASTVTVKAAALRSFYEFVRRTLKLRPDNPVDDVRRPKQAAPTPKGLTADELRALLAAVPGSSSGHRDRAVIVTAVMTGLRRAEVLGLTRGGLDLRGDVAFYDVTTKGGKPRRRELPKPALDAVRAYWRSQGRELDALAPGERVFPVSEAGFAANLKRYAAKAGIGGIHVHALRHSSAKLRRDTGASLEDVQAHLGHANLSTTARYLARLEGQRDTGWQGPAAALGLL